MAAEIIVVSGNLSGKHQTVDRDDVAVGEGEHGVHVHGRSGFGMPATITCSAPPSANSLAATWCDRWTTERDSTSARIGALRR